MNFPVIRDCFDLENDLNIAVAGDSDHFLQRTTASSSRQSVAGTVKELLKLGSFSFTGKVVREVESIAGLFSSTRKLEQGNESVGSVE